MTTRTPRALAGGFFTSEQVQQDSTWLTSDLDDLQNRIDAIKNDESRSAGERADFLKNKFRPEAEQVGRHHLHNIGVGVRKSQERLAAMEPVHKPLSTHAAILLAQSLKDAPAEKRLMMVSTDSRYADLLDDLPAAYFGISDERAAGLMATAARTAQSFEERELEDSLRADEEQFDHLKDRRAKILNEIDDFYKANSAVVEKQDESAHLYKLAKPKS